MLRRSRPSEARVPVLFEVLEDRLALYSSPFLADLPTLTDLQNPANTVVRMQTNQGIIDIELYDRGGPNGGSAAPITTANFLRYINAGQYEKTFFHRLESGFVLQGGGFRFTGGDAPPRETPVETFEAIQNEFNADRSNIAQTLAMAKLGDQPNSATSQYFFNLIDNSSNLDNQNGGFTVFAHVVKGWDIVQAISALSVRNLNQYLSGDPNDAFSKVPVTGPADTDLVLITDIDVIKPAGSQQFFSQSVYFPEGFRSGRSTSTVELVNNDTNAATPYQIIAHFEGGLRDQVIFTNTLAPGEHIEIPIARGGDPSINKVRGGEAFSYEIRSAHAIGATLHHRDFGAWSSEAFVQPEPLAAEQLRSWNFANGLKGENNPSFLVWQNLSDQPATVNVLFFPDGGTPFFIGHVIEPYRRGGLNINDLPSVPNGAFSIQMTSDRPLVAALSQYSIAPGQASMETGVVGGGSTEGVLPGAYIATGGQSIISALYTGASPVVTIDFDFILSDGTVIPSTQPIVLTPSIPRRDLNLASAAALPAETFFTVRYRVRNAAGPVSLAYTGTVLGDTVSTGFQSLGGANGVLAGGFTDPAVASREFVTLYNPFASGTTATYRLRFHFTDGDIVPAAGSGTLAAGRRIDIQTSNLAEVIAKINSGAQFHHYSISVEASFAGTSTTGALFMQLTRFDVGGNTVTTGPTTPAGTSLLRITDPLFH